jgi:hypothetical protein
VKGELGKHEVESEKWKHRVANVREGKGKKSQSTLHEKYPFTYLPK